MTDKNKSKDGKSQGGCCGTFLGCSVVIALIFSFLLGFYIIPKLKENNWSFSASFSEFSSVKSFRNKLSEKITEWNYRYVRAKDAVEDSVEKIQDSAEDLSSKTQKTVKEAKKRLEAEPVPGTSGIGDDLSPSLIEE